MAAPASASSSIDAATAAAIAAAQADDFDYAAYGSVDEGVAQSASDLAGVESEQHAAQADALAAEQSTKPLIAPLESLSSLESEYASNPKFLAKIRATVANGTYTRFRRVRGDGNCFYRGYIFGILQWLSRTLSNESATEAERNLISALFVTLEGSLDALVKQGYPKMTMEDFAEPFLEVFAWVRDTRPSAEDIIAKIEEPAMDQYMITYVRYLTSSYLGSHASEYAPFVPDGRSVEDFRRSDIEPVSHESDYLQIVCLSNLLQVGVRVCYLDQSAGSNSSGSSGSSSGSSDDAMRTYDFPDGAQPRLHLLYRPGHYDVLDVLDHLLHNFNTICLAGSIIATDHGLQL